MDKGTVHIYYGTGKGKTTAAIGQAIKTASEGKTAFVIQFLKERKENEIGFLKRLEPEVKLFRFQKSALSYSDLSDEAKADENQNLRNGLNFAKKVLVTEECDVLVLDEVLGLLKYGIVTPQELRQVIQARNETTTVILTGSDSVEALWDLADEATEMVTRKTAVDNPIQ